MSLTLSCRFEQKEYAAKLGMPKYKGLCLALVAKWCKLILSDPDCDATTRFNKFLTKETYTEIAQQQYTADQRIKRLATTNEGLLQLLKIYKIINNNTEPDEHSIDTLNNITEIANEAKSRADKIPADTLHRSGLTKVGAPVVTDWAKIPENLEKKCCHAIIFSSKSELHVIGIYKPDDIFIQSYNIFDPNYGEFKANRKKYLEHFLNFYGAVYGNPIDARVFKVEL